MKIKPSTYIRNDYAELSSYCKETGEPVYITKNGEGDVVVMSVEAYDKMLWKMKNQEARLYYLNLFAEAEAYNREHPETYTLEEVNQMMEDMLNEKQAKTHG